MRMHPKPHQRNSQVTSGALPQPGKLILGQAGKYRGLKKCATPDLDRSFGNRPIPAKTTDRTRSNTHPVLPIPGKWEFPGRAHPAAKSLIRNPTTSQP